MGLSNGLAVAIEVIVARNNTILNEVWGLIAGCYKGVVSGSSVDYRDRIVFGPSTRLMDSRGCPCISAKETALHRSYTQSALCGMRWKAKGLIYGWMWQAFQDSHGILAALDLYFQAEQVMFQRETRVTFDLLALELYQLVQQAGDPALGRDQNPLRSRKSPFGPKTLRLLPL